MVKQSPELRAVLKKRRNDLYFPATASIFEALASDSNTLDGLNSHAVIIDELHAIKDRNLYELDCRDEWTDLAKWQKANPGIGPIKKYKTLADFVHRAKIKPEDLSGVLCKDFNIREVSAAVWLSDDAIKSDLRFELQDVYNTYALGGCDLSGTTAGRGLYEEIDGGYIDKMSFSFVVRAAEYDAATHIRRITRAY